MPSDDATRTTASRCARDVACLRRAEDRISRMDLAGGRSSLGIPAGSAVTKVKNARWLNAAGLLVLLEGDLFSAVSLLRAALQQPFDLAAPSTHFAAHKNLYWATHLLREATLSNEPVERASSELLDTFQVTRAHIDELPEDDMSPFESTLSIFDLPLQRQVCFHPLYDRHYRPAVWAGLDVATRWRRRYTDLLKRSLTRYLTRDLTEDVRSYKGGDADAVQQACDAAGDDASAACEAEWHIGQGAYTTEGPYSQKWLGGLVHLELLMEDIVRRAVPGDVLEAGCYMAGTSVLLRALLDLEADGAADGAAARPRRLLLADSFEGIPMPRSAKGRQIDTSAAWPERYVAGQAAARSTLRRYGLLDARVVFVPGYFNVSLRAAPADVYSLIHIDADAYDSVLDALEASYPKLARGGYVVVDDFHLPGVRAACRDFRKRHNVTAPILPVPTDHITTCEVDWAEGGAFTVHPLTVGYWMRGEHESFES